MADTSCGTSSTILARLTENPSSLTDTARSPFMEHCNASDATKTRPGHAINQKHFRGPWCREPGWKGLLGTGQTVKAKRSARYTGPGVESTQSWLISFHPSAQKHCEGVGFKFPQLPGSSWWDIGSQFKLPFSRVMQNSMKQDNGK